MTTEEPVAWLDALQRHFDLMKADRENGDDLLWTDDYEDLYHAIEAALAAPARCDAQSETDHIDWDAMAEKRLGQGPQEMPAQGTKLATLVLEYARDLRRNSSGGDNYPWEYAKATADYLEELVRRSETKPAQWDASTEVITDEQLAISGMNKDWNRLYSALRDIISIAKDAQATDALGDIVRRAKEELGEC